MKIRWDFKLINTELKILNSQSKKWQKEDEYFVRFLYDVLSTHWMRTDVYFEIHFSSYRSMFATSWRRLDHVFARNVFYSRATHYSESYRVAVRRYVRQINELHFLPSLYRDQDNDNRWISSESGILIINRLVFFSVTRSKTEYTIVTCDDLWSESYST